MSRVINQYSLDGDFICSWPSMTEASQQLYIPLKSISNVCCGRAHSTGGFIFRRDGEPLDLPRNILQINKNGEICERYATIANASSATGLNRGSISHCLNGDRKYCGDFQWVWAWNYKGEINDELFQEQIY